MEEKFYFKWEKTLLIGGIILISCFNLKAQIYTDTTNLVSDLEAGIYEEYILAPAAVTDTFFMPEMVTLSTDVTIKALDGLDFKPVVTGNPDDKQSYLFTVENVDGGAEIMLEGIHFVSEVRGNEAINNGTFRVFSEDVNITVKSCDFYHFPSYNAIAKVYNSGGDITIDDVVVYDCAGKIVQVNYKDDDATPNYVPIIGDLTITNSSFVKIYKRIFFELGAGNVPIDENDPEIKQRFNAGAENLTIDKCTFYGHEGVNVMQGRSLYEFIGDQAAIKNQLSITNTIFSNMDKNLNADSASVTIFDYNYYINGFGVNLDVDETLEDFSKYNPTNSITTDPVFADTTNGAWDLRLQNKDDMLGSDGNPIGDPRWWDGTVTSINNLTLENTFAKIYSFQNRAIIETEEIGGEIMIYNILGKLEYQSKINSTRNEVVLRNGLYIVHVTTDRGREAKKVVIN